MNSQSPPPATKKSWFLIFSALVIAVGIYGLLCFLITQNPNPRRNVAPNLDTFRFLLGTMAFFWLIASVVWLRFRIDGRIGGGGRSAMLSPQEFQTESIIALALSEACAIFGLLLFFLGGRVEEFFPFAFGTLFVDFAFILPRGVQFWSTQK